LTGCRLGRPVQRSNGVFRAIRQDWIDTSPNRVAGAGPFESVRRSRTGNVRLITRPSAWIDAPACSQLGHRVLRERRPTRDLTPAGPEREIAGTCPSHPNASALALDVTSRLETCSTAVR